VREAETVAGQIHEFLTAVFFAIPQDIPNAYAQVQRQLDSNSPVKSRKKTAPRRGLQKADDLYRMILSAGPKNSGRHSLDLVLVALDCEEPEAVPIETIVYDIGTLQDLESLPSPKRGSVGQSFVEQSESLSVVHNWVALFERAGELLLQVALDRFSAEDAAPFVPALAEQEPINRWVHFLFASLSVHRRHLVEWTEEKTGRWGVLPSLAKSSIVEIDYLLNALSRPTEEQPPEPAEATDDKDDTGRIPPRFKTKPLPYCEAGKLLGYRGSKDKAREWVKQCIADGTLHCEKGTRKLHFFDIREFPENTHARIQPNSDQ